MIKEYAPDKVRNVVILGHAGTGKSTLLDAILYVGKKIGKIGRNEDGTLVSDFDMEETKRNMSVHTAMGFVEIDDIKINIIDCPGLQDFIGERRAAIQAADAVILCVDSVDGVQIGTEKAWRYLSDNNIPRVIFVSKMDKERASYEKVIKSLEDNLHAHFVSLCIPMGEGENFEGIVDIFEMHSMKPKEPGSKDIVVGDIPENMKDYVREQRTKLIEVAAEGDDELIEMFLEGKEFDEKLIKRGIKEQMVENKLHPIICGSAFKDMGILNLLHVLENFIPSADERKECAAIDVANNNNEFVLECKPSNSFSAIVWKTYVDQYAGRFNYIRVMSGKLTPDTEILNSSKNEKEKIGKLYTMIGKELIEVPKLNAGDIGVITKLEHTSTKDTLCASDKPVILPIIELPHPVFSYAIKAKDKKDEEKLAQLLIRNTEQYPTFQYGFNSETKQSVLSGMGQLHLDILLDEIKEKYNIEVETEVPRIAYRETITKSSEAQYKHKKQSGGHGQYGEVYLRMKPLDRGTGIEFKESIVGGVVPKQYIPGVEKGVKEATSEGVVAKYPVVDVTVDLFDGSYHAVDSSEMAFKIAGTHAFRKAMEAAGPQLLEPIMSVEIYVDKEFMGDIMSDITSRRGKVLGMNSKDESSDTGITVIKAQIPLAEMQRYSVDLKSMTSNKATFTSEFSHYDPINGKIAQKVIEERKKMLEEISGS
jgi:elongation factor G